MYIEHAIYTLALCVIAGMIYEKYTDRNPSWIIWFAVFLPDIDFIVEVLMKGLPPYKIPLIEHGDFHNIFVLIFVSVLLGWYIWKHTNVRFTDATFCVGLGFLSHLVEDALVNNANYHYLYPVSNQVWHTGFVLEPLLDIEWGSITIGSTNVIVIGMILLISTILIRSYVQGFGWLKKYTPFLSLKTADQTPVVQLIIKK